MGFNYWGFRVSCGLIPGLRAEGLMGGLGFGV